jgi:isopenicillin N synthase-like dioxygenase
VDADTIPIIDVGPLVRREPGSARVGEALGRACRTWGFFYVAGHGVDPALEARLEDLSRQFFALPQSIRMQIRMELGGRAWRGYFPVGAELTSGRPDQKEGIYFGQELAVDHPLVQANTPLHGPNLFPELPGFRETVLAYMQAMTSLGHALMEGLALGLGLPASYFAERYTRDPLTLFRIFHYPAHAPDQAWGVGEHTDYGVLTILRQDDVGGLQVRTHSRWTEAPPRPGTYICNLGDMLDRMTGGFYRSTLHRVRSHPLRDRLSFPFFFDPNFFAEVHPIGLPVSIADDHAERWDRASVHTFRGTYGQYLLQKVGRVFPQLFDAVLDERDPR